MHLVSLRGNSNPTHHLVIKENFRRLLDFSSVHHHALLIEYTALLAGLAYILQYSADLGSTARCQNRYI